MSVLIRLEDAIDTFLSATSDGDKADWCIYVLKSIPSIEVPTPHGRLIDADTFIKEWHLGYQCENCENDARRCGWQELTKMDICGMIEDAPTVIESEE